MRCQRLVCGVGQEELQQQGLLERTVVVIGDNEDHGSFRRSLNCDTFVVLGGQGLLELQQFFADELGSCSQVAAFHKCYASGQDAEGNIAPFEDKHIAVVEGRAVGDMKVRDGMYDNSTAF